MKWHAFDKTKGYRQKRPPVYRLVLVQLTEIAGYPPAVVVGYMKNAAGDKNSPYFVVPAARSTEVVAWSDCLGDDFHAPLWKMKQEVAA